MNERDLDILLQHLRDKLSKFVNRPNAAWQVEMHGKGASIQVRVTEIDSVGKTPLEERR